MKNPFAALFRARDKPQDSVSAAPTFYFGTSGSGKPVNANTAIQLSTVYKHGGKRLWLILLPLLQPFLLRSD